MSVMHSHTDCQKYIHASAVDIGMFAILSIIVFVRMILLQALVCFLNMCHGGIVKHCAPNHWGGGGGEVGRVNAHVT